MGYRHDMSGKSAQARAIVSARDEEDKRRAKELKKKQELEKLILEYFNEQIEPKSPNDICVAIKGNGLEVLRALSDLVKQRKIDTKISKDKTSDVNSLHYFIKKVNSLENE